MSETGCALPQTNARPTRLSPLTALVTSLALVTGMIIWLRLLGRPWTCPCGVVEFWQGDLSASENSQQFSDWYSALHVIFGMAIYGFVTWMKPGWSLAVLMVTAAASSVAWEAMENMPALISLFSNEMGQNYSGDSVLNAVGDTIFVVAGLTIAHRLPAWAAVAIAAGLEATVSLAIGDGFLIGVLTLLGSLF